MKYTDMSNSSLDFLNMIKNQGNHRMSAERAGLASDCKIAVIDTETNWHDKVMSIGIAIADTGNFKCIDKRYYVLEPECSVGGMYSSVLHVRDVSEVRCNKRQALKDINSFLGGHGITKILAYNARFDRNHLQELAGFEWFDIMRLAAYKQYNHAIEDSFPCCKTGRLKTDYGVEPIMHLLTGDFHYAETHNALLDAIDELKIVELLGHPVDKYECGRIE